MSGAPQYVPDDVAREVLAELRRLGGETPDTLIDPWDEWTLSTADVLRVVRAGLDALARRPDPLGEALNSGDGSYRP